MTDETDKIVLRLREDIARLNATLDEACRANLTVEFKATEHRMVGSPAPLISVSGRATRSRIELDERL